MDTKIVINSLPAIELWVCLPEGYPNYQPPMFMQRTNFFIKHLKLNEFIESQIKEMWSEETPMLYQMAMFV